MKPPTIMLVVQLSLSLFHSLRLWRASTWFCERWDMSVGIILGPL